MKLRTLNIVENHGSSITSFWDNETLKDTSCYKESEDRERALDPGIQKSQPGSPNWEPFDPWGRSNPLGRKQSHRDLLSEEENEHELLDKLEREYQLSSW